jgi:hypothetical protein
LFADPESSIENLGKFNGMLTCVNLVYPEVDLKIEGQGNRLKKKKTELFFWKKILNSSFILGVFLCNLFFMAERFFVSLI